MPQDSPQDQTPENNSSVFDKNVPNPLAKNPNVHTHKVFASVGLILVGTIITLAFVLFGSAYVLGFDVADLFGTKPAQETTTKVSTSSATPGTSSENKTETKDETADWKTYKSEKNKFSIQYPPEYKLSESADYVRFASENHKEDNSGSLCGYNITSSGGYLQIKVGTHSGDPNTLNELVVFYFDGKKNDYKTANSSNYVLAGREAVRIVYTGPSKTTDCVLSSIETENSIVTTNSFGLDYRVEMRYISTEEKTLLKNFDLMLNTFKFL